ncbi:MAG: hypothetical protein GYB68_04910, partial [Chloroflexi bacterium]|nr:hypothetical protein [Chloroflexota bacterium]
TDNAPMIEMPAITGAAPIWKAIMEYAHLGTPVEDWDRPENVVELTVCQVSGLLPTEYCPTQQEIFLEGTEPTTRDNVWQPFFVNRDTNLLATVYTPPELIEQRVYMILPARADDWLSNAGVTQPPTEYDTIITPDLFGNVAILNPAPFSYVQGAVTVRGNATDGNFQLYRLDYGKGLNPTEWTQIGADSFSTAYNEDLGIWDARELDGLYSLRLTVIRGDNSIEEFVTQVTVDNRPPTIEVISPLDGQQFSLSDEFVTIQPIVTDDISMDRVEFYVDGQLIATSTIAPYNERWLIPADAVGQHFIEIRAFDTVGNTSASQRITIEIVP